MKHIALSQGEIALVDDDDFERVSKFKWHVSRQRLGGYCQVIHRTYPKPCKTGSRGKATQLSRFVMNAKKGQLVDHIDGDTLNNQKSNLRFVTRSQNGCNSKPKKINTSGFKGVSKNASGRWIAQITLKRTYHWLGSYSSKEEAAAAYDAAAVIIHGEFARTNKELNLL